MSYCVYLHTNKINGKKYVGQTCQIPEKRWKKGLGYKESVGFFNAILKYSWDNFEHEIVYDNLTKEEADYFEDLMINSLNTTDYNYGYNIKNGGSIGKHSEETKQKIRTNSKGKHQNVIVSTETKQKISNTLKEYYKIHKPRSGFKHSEESKKKMSEAHKNISDETRKKMSLATSGKNNPMYGKPGTNLGKKFSEEHKKRIGEANKGKKRSLEARQKMSLAQKGKQPTEKQLAYWASMKGKKLKNKQ